MIKHLRLTNFRRHADTDIQFDQGGQIILISGQNGTGKSTVIEAITYALYGEGRHGNRHLDQMIRRGAEIEGMEVELEFDLADTTYVVRRRRDNKISSAVLWGNDVPLVEGPREVTEHISHLLGMDVRGFRLAVVAQQKELDGLASMRPGDRAIMLARLLRLDAVTRARDEARSIFRSERDALRGLGAVDVVADIDAALEQLDTAQSALRSAYAESEAALLVIDERLAKAGAVEAAWRAATEQMTRLEGMVSAAEADVARLTQEMERTFVGEEITDLANLDDLAEQVAEVERAVAAAEANATLASQAHMVRGELERVSKRIATLSETLSQADGLDVAKSEAELTTRRAELAELTARRDTLSSDQTRARVAQGNLEARLAELAELSATCESCGQAVSEEHKHAQVESTTSSLAGATKALEAVTTMLGSLDVEIAAKRSEVAAAEAALGAARVADERISAARDELVDLKRREGTYSDQLARITVEDFDLDALLARRAELAIEVSTAQAAHDAARLRELALERRSGIEESLQGALERLASSREALANGQVPSDIVAEHEAVVAAREAREIEAALAGDLATQIAVGDERRGGLLREKTRLEAQRARRSELERGGQVASETSNVLDAVATRLNQQIRPALEGSVGELLSRLSDGRFDAVTIDEFYNVSVRDGGAFRALGEFSGGEIDLIALAMRLALANVVSERHGSGGAGFLILDECFGSQDADRRGSILTALRGLRGTYGQILLISHVGGIEDSADRVIEISIDEETGIATASAE